MRRVDSLEKTLMLGGIGGRRRRGWQRMRCLEGLGARGEGDDIGWDGWMASPTLWTWFWVNSGSWWWTGRPGLLQFMGSQRVGNGWETELNWLILGSGHEVRVLCQYEVVYHNNVAVQSLSYIWFFVISWTSAHQSSLSFTIFWHLLKLMSICQWFITNYSQKKRVSLHSSVSRNLPTKQETQVIFLGQEDHLEKEMTTHPSILAWRILWTEESCSHGVARAGHNLVTKPPSQK